MRHDTSPPANDAADVFGVTRRRRRSGPIVAIALCLLLIRFALVGLGDQSVRAFLHIGSSLPSCEAAQISTPQAREGMCTRTSGLFTDTVYNVVDRDHVLRMPEYQARLLNTMIALTRVRRTATNAAEYPTGRGLLVSFEVTIANINGRPLPFGPGIGYQPRPSYPQETAVELLLPTASDSNNDLGYPAVLNGRRAPSPSIFQRRPIPASGVLTGWVTFVVPLSARYALDARPADLDFFRTNHDPHYVGQIRLWK
jgi:hypothetical protein